jgi:hypothetical protein
MANANVQGEDVQTSSKLFPRSQKLCVTISLIEKVSDAWMLMSKGRMCAEGRW